MIGVTIGRAGVQVIESKGRDISVAVSPSVPSMLFNSDNTINTETLQEIAPILHEYLERTAKVKLNSFTIVDIPYRFVRYQFYYVPGTVKNPLKYLLDEYNREPIVPINPETIKQYYFAAYPIGILKGKQSKTIVLVTAIDKKGISPYISAANLMGFKKIIFEPTIISNMRNIAIYLDNYVEQYKEKVGLVYVHIDEHGTNLLSVTPQGIEGSFIDHISLTDIFKIVYDEFPDFTFEDINKLLNWINNPSYPLLLADRELSEIEKQQIKASIGGKIKQFIEDLASRVAGAVRSASRKMNMENIHVLISGLGAGLDILKEEISNRLIDETIQIKADEALHIYTGKQYPSLFNVSFGHSLYKSGVVFNKYFVKATKDYVFTDYKVIEKKIRQPFNIAGMISITTATILLAAVPWGMMFYLQPKWEEQLEIKRSQYDQLKGIISEVDLVNNMGKNLEDIVLSFNDYRQTMIGKLLMDILKSTTKAKLDSEISVSLDTYRIDKKTTKNVVNVSFSLVSSQYLDVKTIIAQYQSLPGVIDIQIPSVSYDDNVYSYPVNIMFSLDKLYDYYINNEHGGNNNGKGK